MNFLRNLWQARSLEQAAREEVQSHLEQRAAELISEGLPPREAALRARREFGNVATLCEEIRQVWIWTWWERLARDVRFGMRLMARSPGFTTIAVLSLALGIGANTAIFGLLDKLDWRMLPVRTPEELRIVEVVRAGKTGGGDTSYSYPQYELWRDESKSFGGLAAYSAGLRWHDRSAATDLWHNGQFVSGNYFDVLGVRAAFGRTIAPADDSVEGAGGPDGPVGVVSFRYWTTAMGADLSALGKPVNVNGVWITIVGVTPPEFFGTQVGRQPDLYVPLHLQPAILPVAGSLLQDPPSGGTTWVSVFGRLLPGVADSQAQADLNVIFERYRLTRMNRTDRAAYLAKQKPLGATVALVSGSRGLSQLRDRFSEPLKILMALVGVVLLIACLNVAGLLLARGNARTGEIALRLALGAPRSRIVRQLLTESALLSLTGGALGLCFAFWSGQALLHMLPKNQQAVGLDPSIDARLLAFVFALSATSALIFGLTPAMHASRRAVHQSMKRGGRLSLGKGLVAAEIALTLPLLAGAGLLVGTLRHLTTVDTGFLSQNVLQVRINVDRANVPRAQWRGIYEELVERARSIPGVRAASIVSHELLTEDATSSGPVHFPGYRFGEGETRNLLATYAGSDYFAAAGIPVRSGRIFAPADEKGRAKVAMVNEALVRQYFAGRDPVGQRFGFGDDPDDIEIVGIVSDVKYSSLRQDPLPMAYYPWPQMMPARMSALIVRTQGAAQGVETSLIKLTNDVRPDLLLDVKTLSSQIDDATSRERMLARISGFFGGLALLLVGIGCYGIMAYDVIRRTREIGIRIALGATERGIVRLMLRETILIGAAGLTAGVPIAIAAGHTLRSLLFGVTPNDPLVLGGSLALLLALFALAAYVPVRGASRVAPIVALRHD